VSREKQRAHAASWRIARPLCTKPQGGAHCIAVALTAAIFLQFLALPALHAQEAASPSSSPSPLSPAPSPVSPASRSSSQPPMLEAISRFSNWGKGRMAPIRVSAEEGLDWTEDGILVARQRTSIGYLDYEFQADRALLDPRIEEVRAEGNVIFSGPNMELHCNAIRYNFRLEEGVAYGVEGRHSMLFFRCQPDEITGGPSFRRISPEQALLTDATFSGCDFPVPHYYLRGSEVIIILGERVLVRDAVLYVGGIPMLYFPAYTKSLREPSPWSFYFGYSSRLGIYGRLMYDYRHETSAPDYLNPSKYRKRTWGHASLFTDYFTRRGSALGLKYCYDINYGQHRGSLFAYGVRDEGREDVIDEESTPNRLLLRWGDRSRLEDHTIFQMSIDEVSDPDIYSDFIDRFEDIRLGRRPERRMRFAVTYAREAFVARVMADIRDRVARNTFRDPADPYADELDYDPDPSRLGDGDEGISGRRYGGAGRRLPQVDLTTAHIKLWQTPFFYDSEFHAINAMDRGLNPLLTKDDTWIEGADWRQGVLFRIALSERYTWLHRFGVGVAYFDRHDEGLNLDLPPNATFPRTLDNLYLVDRDTWLSGQRERSFHDVENGFLYYTYQTRLNARFTDTLEGYLQYTLLDGTANSLGDFYRRIGMRTAQTDIYRFPVKTNMVEGFLNYHLLYPNMSLYGRAGQNLHRDHDIAPYELLRYAGLGGSYANDTKEFEMSLGTDLQSRQIRDISDPNNYEQSALIHSGTVRFAPRHERWWARFSVFAVEQLETDPATRPASAEDSYDETETKFTFAPAVGARVGPKYSTEFTGVYSTEMQDWQEAFITLRRDLHDAEVGLHVGYRTVETVDGGTLDRRREEEIRLSLRVKAPGATREVAPGSTRKLLGTEKTFEFNLE